jgi:hypothetical protein
MHELNMHDVHDCPFCVFEKYFDHTYIDKKSFKLRFKRSRRSISIQME